MQCTEKVLGLIENVKSGLQSHLALLTFWPNNSLLWGCLMHWKMFSSTPGLYPLEANSGRQSTYSKYPNQSSYWWNWKTCLLFYEKNTKWTFWPTQYTVNFILSYLKQQVTLMHAIFYTCILCTVVIKAEGSICNSVLQVLEWSEIIYEVHSPIFPHLIANLYIPHIYNIQLFFINHLLSPTFMSF